MNKDVVIFMNFRRLRHLQRCNNFSRNNPEDVAQHSYYTSLLAMTIADEYNAWVDAHVSETERYEYQKANVEIVLRKALLHDTDEAITSDVPYNVKHLTPEFNEEIEKAMSVIINQSYEGCSDIFERYCLLARNCKKDLEGTIVDIADMLELAIYCHEEYASGNTFMKGLRDRAVHYVQLKNSEIFNSSPTAIGLSVLIQSNTKLMETIYTL